MSQVWRFPQAARKHEDAYEAWTSPDPFRPSKSFFREYPNPFRPDDDILKLLEICLTTNKLEFAERLFLQVLGMAMGKSFAPSLATKLDRKTSSHVGPKLDFFSRFIDELLFLLP